MKRTAPRRLGSGAYLRRVPTASFGTSALFGKFAARNDEKEGNVPVSRRRARRHKQGAVPSLYTTRAYGGGQGHVGEDTRALNVAAKTLETPQSQFILRLLRRPFLTFL